MAFHFPIVLFLRSFPSFGFLLIAPPPPLVQPIPFFASPMGPLGRLQGLLVWAGVTMMNLFSWVQSISGLSPLLTGCLLCGLAVFGGMFSMILLVVVFTPGDKPHRD